MNPTPDYDALVANPGDPAESLGALNDALEQPAPRITESTTGDD